MTNDVPTDREPVTLYLARNEEKSRRETPGRTPARFDVRGSYAPQTRRSNDCVSFLHALNALLSTSYTTCCSFTAGMRAMDRVESVFTRSALKCIAVRCGTEGVRNGT